MTPRAVSIDGRVVFRAILRAQAFVALLHDEDVRLLVGVDEFGRGAGDAERLRRARAEMDDDERIRHERLLTALTTAAFP